MTRGTHSLRTPARSGGQPVRRVTIASGKGGVGKTWLASSLSHALSFAGERVLLFDGDLGLANVDVQLRLSPDCDIASVVAGEVGLKDAITPFDGGAQGPRGGFDVLAGRSGSGALEALGPVQSKALADGLRLLSGQYDRIVLDIAAGVDGVVTELSAAGELILVVLTDEPTSLTDAYAYLKVMARRDGAPPMAVVVNMASSQSEGRRTHEALARACRQFLHWEPPLLGIVRRDAKVKETIRAQAPILTRYPQSTAAQDVTALAEALRKRQMGDGAS